MALSDPGKSNQGATSAQNGKNTMEEAALTLEINHFYCKARKALEKEFSLIVWWVKATYHSGVVTRLEWTTLIVAESRGSLSHLHIYALANPGGADMTCQHHIQVAVVAFISDFVELGERFS